MKKNTIFVDKQYKLVRATPPLSLILASRHTQRFPLLHWDEKEGTNRPLRYARNQRTPFQDDQDNNAILEPIVFDDGFLNVPKNNQVLQQFLALHPSNGNLFVEVDKVKEAAEVVEDLNGEDHLYMSASFFQSDEGLESYKHLKELAKNK